MAGNFCIREVSADKAYSARSNLRAIVDAGGTPYIPFKTNLKARERSDPKYDEVWERMYHIFAMNQAEFNLHYHKRSNIETAFHMIKAKFGDKVRSKTPVAGDGVVPQPLRTGERHVRA